MCLFLAHIFISAFYYFYSYMSRSMTVVLWVCTSYKTILSLTKQDHKIRNGTQLPNRDENNMIVIISDVDDKLGNTHRTYQTYSWQI